MKYISLHLRATLLELSPGEVKMMLMLLLLVVGIYVKEHLYDKTCLQARRSLIAEETAGQRLISV